MRKKYPGHGHILSHIRSLLFALQYLLLRPPYILRCNMLKFYFWFKYSCQYYTLLQYNKIMKGRNHEGEWEKWLKHWYLCIIIIIIKYSSSSGRKTYRPHKLTSTRKPNTNQLKFYVVISFKKQKILRNRHIWFRGTFYYICDISSWIIEMTTVRKNSAKRVKLCFVNNCTIGGRLFTGD